MNKDSWQGLRARSGTRPAIGAEELRTDGDARGCPARSREQAWRGAAEALTELDMGLVVIDAATERVLFANDALAAIVGRAIEEVHDAPFVDLLVPEDAPCARLKMRETTLGAASGPVPLRLHHGARRAITVDASFRAFERGDGRGTALLVALAPTATRDEVRSLRSALGSALDALRQRDDLFALAAHELRTPLTPLVLELQSIRRAPRLDGVVRSSLTAAEAQAKRLALLVEQLLDVARARAGRLVVERLTTDLATVVRESVARFASEGARCGTTITVECGAPVIGRWDALRVDQIVSNLVANALRHAPGSPLHVSLAVDGVEARITVRDHGPGIAPENAARIFERFERAGDGTVRGAGLGLWIARQLAEAHGGAIRVESAPGDGATFVVTLPIE